VAGDLIPPPSPAGRPDPDAGREQAAGTFSESELLRTDAEREAAAEAETPIEPAAASPYRSRFGFVFGALVGLGVAAVVIIALVVTSGDPVREPQWSAWQPESEEPDIRAVEIAKQIGSKYRLNSGDQLVDVYAQRLEIDGTPLQVVIRSAAKGEGADIIDVPGDSLLFVLKGLGERGSIDTEEPSEKRLRLVQREAYELALHAFKYVDGIDSVVAFLPPPPPAAGSAQNGPTGSAGAGSTTAAAAEGQPVPALLFLPGDLERALKRPLALTLPSTPPRPSTMTDAEADAFGNFAQVHGFNASVVSDQTGAGFLVLDRASSSAAAQKTLREALKA
jgi:hypothetical protein